MTKELLIHAGIAELTVVMVEDGVLSRFWQESTIGSASGENVGTGAQAIGDIVLGRVTRVVPGINAAFVDVGMERAGFLAARDAAPRGGDREHGAGLQAHIAHCVREGEVILTQILKDPMGEKGARLTTEISLAGRLLVLVPGRAEILVSRRITEEDERARLAEIAATLVQGGAGYIVRTSAAGASEAELRDDAARLAEDWQGVVAARARAAAEPPALLHREMGAVERSLRDEADGDVQRIVIDDAAALAQARAYAMRAMAKMEDRITLYQGREPLFEAFGVAEEIAQLGDRRLGLVCGGWITIEATEGMTAIDVNSGSTLAPEDPEAMALNVNLEAAETIGRQIVLRGLGGLIVIDFIHQSSHENLKQVTDTLRAVLARDKAPAELVSVAEFGLVVLTRKRVRHSLAERMTEPCAQCNGEGRRKTTVGVATEILRQVERAVLLAPGKKIRIHAAPEVADWFDAHRDELHTGLARRGALGLEMVGEAGRERARFVVDTGS